MNPWSLLIIGIGVLLIIIGVKGSYGNVIASLTGKPYQGGSSSATGGGGSSSVPPSNVPRSDWGILGPRGRRPL